jgi:hypothetical protein
VAPLYLCWWRVRRREPLGLFTGSSLRLQGIQNKLREARRIGIDQWFIHFMQSVALATQQDHQTLEQSKNQNLMAIIHNVRAADNAAEILAIAAEEARRAIDGPSMPIEF